MPECKRAVSSPDHSRRVSPELVLVDPELAARERADLSLPVAPLERVAPEVPDPGDPGGELTATPAPELERQLEQLQWHRRRSWPRLAGTAAVVAASLLLLDVRVEVGKSPASAEPTSPGITAPARPSQRPVSPAPASPRPKSVRPKSSSGPERDLSPKLESRRFAWAPVKGAVGYRIEIREGTKLIFARETTRPEVEIPRTWKRAGVEHALRPGEYRWYVWPIIAGLRSTKAVVQASLTIPE
jgi:hypothetical protein